MTDTTIVAEPVPFVYIPAGAAELYSDEKMRSAAVDLLDKVSSRPEGVHISAQWARDRFRTTGGRGKQSFVWDTLRNDLTAQGVMTEGVSYIPGVRAKRYKLSDSWATRPRRRYPAALGDRQYKTRDEETLKVPPWALSCLHAATFDLEGAVTAILIAAGVESGRADELAARCDFNEIADAIATSAGPVYEAKATERMVGLWRWQVDKHTWARRDRSGHRVHTAITSLANTETPKVKKGQAVDTSGLKHAPLRPFLSLGPLGDDDGALVEIDATNSQMVFLAKLALDELGTDDAREFAEVCYGGKFYEESYFTVYGRYPSKAERSAWKGRIMGAWLYGEDFVQRNSKEGLALAARWPTVHEWIWKAKEASGTAELPCRMQRLEATIWIDRLVPALAAQKIPVLTIHDCVVVPASKAEAALATVKALYADAGLTAQFACTVITNAASTSLPEATA